MSTDFDEKFVKDIINLETSTGYFLSEGESFHLNCKVGNDFEKNGYEIYLTHNGTRIENNEFVTVTTEVFEGQLKRELNLKIPQTVEARDKGDYACVAQNSSESRSKVATLNFVQDLPELHKIEQVSHDENVKFTFNHSAISNTFFTSYNLIRKRHASKARFGLVTASDSLMFFVLNPCLDDTGNFTLILQTQSGTFHRVVFKLIMSCEFRLSSCLMTMSF